MASSFDSLLRLELQATGENANTWGEKTNNNLELLSVAIAGALSISVAGSGDYTLTTANAASDQARFAFITLTGTLTGARNLIVPASGKTYFIRNNTTGSHTLTVKTAAGTGVAVPQGFTLPVVCDGTDCHGAGEANRVSRSGDTMTGALIVPNATADDHALNRITADGRYLTPTSAESAYVNASGDTMTGALLFASGTTAAPSLAFASDTNTGIFLAGSDTLAFSTGGLERTRIGSGGAFLVGMTTAAPTSTDPGVHLSPAGLVEVRRTGTAGTYASFVNGTALVGSVSPNGTTGVTYNTTSDYRLKSEVSIPAGFLAKLESLPVRKYKWYAEPEQPAEYGVFAHELQAVWPQAVRGEKDAPGMQMVDYGRITPLLIGALKETLRKIDELEDRLLRIEQN